MESVEKLEFYVFLGWKEIFFRFSDKVNSTRIAILLNKVCRSLFVLRITEGDLTIFNYRKVNLLMSWIVFNDKWLSNLRHLGFSAVLARFGGFEVEATVGFSSK